MKNELELFNYFKKHQLLAFNPETGVLDTQASNGRMYYDVGSINEDGYVRLRCNNVLCMKHRLVYWLYHGVLPDSGHEIDHINANRSDNRIANLQILSKADNNRRKSTTCNKRKFGKQYTKEQVIKVCELLANTNLSDLEIAKVIGRSRCGVRDIKTRRCHSKESAPYTWDHRNQ